MTIQQLLYPRYKVLTDYPGCLVQEGSIITLTDKAAVITSPGGAVSEQSKLYFDGIEKYPKVFQKLWWFEERRIEELSEVRYLKFESGSRVFDVRKWEDIPNYLGHPRFEYTNRVGESLTSSVIDLYIATKEEYETYLASQVQVKDKWWVGKEEKDMPEYIKLVDDEDDRIVHVYKIYMWKFTKNEWSGWAKGESGVVVPNEYTFPATQAEYLQFINDRS